MKAKYAHLLADANVRRWFDELVAQSLVYCDLNRIDPKTILKVVETKAFRDDPTDFIRMMEGR